MKDGPAVSSEIEIQTKSQPSPQGTSRDPRLQAAAALVDLLRRAGIDCELVAPSAEGDLAHGAQRCIGPH